MDNCSSSFPATSTQPFAGPPDQVTFLSEDFCSNPSYPILSVFILNDPCDIYNIKFGNDINI